MAGELKEVLLPREPCECDTDQGLLVEYLPLEGEKVQSWS